MIDKSKPIHLMFVGERIFSDGILVKTFDNFDDAIQYVSHHKRPWQYIIVIMDDSLFS
jgi:hypothetical protein